MKRICLFCILLSLLCGCATVERISAFSRDQVELGITELQFVSKYGKPYNQEIFSNDNVITKKLLYKEELYISGWYDITTAFYFENDTLVKQEVVREERKFQSCSCENPK